MAQIDKSGPYTARAKSWVLDQSASGNNMLKVQWAVQIPPTEAEVATAKASGEGVVPKTAYVNSYIVFSPGAMARSVQSLEYMGNWVGDDIRELDNSEGGLDTNEVELEIEMEEYESKWRPKVKWINRKSGVSRKNAIDPNELKSAALDMKSMIAAARDANAKKNAERFGGTGGGTGVGAGTAKTKVTKPANEFELDAPVHDDDIPF